MSMAQHSSCSGHLAALDDTGFTFYPTCAFKAELFFLQFAARVLPLAALYLLRRVWLSCIRLILIRQYIRNRVVVRLGSVTNVQPVRMA